MIALVSPFLSFFLLPFAYFTHTSTSLSVLPRLLLSSPVHIYTQRFDVKGQGGRYDLTLHFFFHPLTFFFLVLLLWFTIYVLTGSWLVVVA